MENLLEIRNISKEYPGVLALDNVNFNILSGEIHAIIGENGAGKSTLIKVIAGATAPSNGTLKFKGEDFKVTHPKDAIEKGVAVVYQEFNLFPNLSVYENIFFGIELKKGVSLDRSKMIKESEKVVKDLGIDIDVKLPVKSLPVAYQQIVEIARCLIRNVELIIMDEPSAPLTEKEVKTMISLVKKLNKKGVAIIYISHKLEEVQEIADRITVLRDGEYIDTLENNNVSEAQLIKLMVGRDLTDIYPEKRNITGDTVLECKNLSGGMIKDVSFNLKKGEVLGFGGLVGSGRTEVMRLLFGADTKESGEIYLNNEKVEINRPTDAIHLGIGLIPEDRKQQGLVLNKDILFNSILPNLDIYKSSNEIKLNRKKAVMDVKTATESLKVKMVDINQLARNLSGGNQQKVVIAKWLLHDCDILIMDEPTRGIDVGAKQEIYYLIDELAKKGNSIIVVSSEMPELIGLSDRVVVMSEGRVSGELNDSEITQEKIMELASITKRREIL